MKRKVKLVITSLSLASILVVLFQNCGSGWVNKVTAGGSFSLKSEDPGGGSPGFVEFQKGLYAWGKDNSCTTCHAGTIKPYFVSPDATIAYNEAKDANIVDFGNPANSVVIGHSGNGHCNVLACQNPASPAKVTELVQAWALAENGPIAPGGPTPTTMPSGPLPKFLTATVPMPATIPTTMVANPAIIRLQLSGLGIPALANAILEIEIQMITPDFYRISRPKIGGNSAAVNVTGLHVFIKGPNDGGIGTEDAEGSLWDNLTATAAVFQLPANLPATRINAVALTLQAITTPKKAVAPAVDMITVAFDNIQ